MVEQKTENLWVGGSNPPSYVYKCRFMLINFFFKVIPIYKLIPEIWLLISIFVLLVYNCIFGEQFKHIYSTFIFLYCVISLLIALVLLLFTYKFSFFTYHNTDFILMNYKN